MKEMSYKKLNEYFDELCESKKLDKELLFRDFIKEFVNNNKSDLKSKHKFYLKTDEKPTPTLIFGDNGDFFELSDGSQINKETFEKIYKNENEPILVNPTEFFDPAGWHQNIKFEEKVNPSDFFNKSFFNWEVKKYFENLDLSKIKFREEEPPRKVYERINVNGGGKIQEGDEEDLKEWRKSFPYSRKWNK